MNALPTTSNDALRNFLTATRQAQHAQVAPRLIFALDATASREPTWALASELQAEMFAAATEAAGSLAVQLVYFRGDEFRASRL